MTQRQLVLNHLMEGKELSPQEALSEYGCFRLGARIFDLRKAGYQIKTTIKTSKNKIGGCSSYAVYKLIKDKGDM